MKAGESMYSHNRQLLRQTSVFRAIALPEVYGHPFGTACTEQGLGGSRSSCANGSFEDAAVTELNRPKQLVRAVLFTMMEETG